MFMRNHYIQNGKYKICVHDLIKFVVNYQNIESAFYEKNSIL